MNDENFKLVKGSLSRRDGTAPSDGGLTPEELLARSRITPSLMLPPMQPLFQMYGVPCFYRGELVAACGKAKSGKTMFLSAIMAAALTEKVLALERSAPVDDSLCPAEMKEIKESHAGCGSLYPTESAERGSVDEAVQPDSQPSTLYSSSYLQHAWLAKKPSAPLRVLWLDTEQSQQSTQDILVNRIIPLCRGDTVEKFDESFFAYNLRGLGFEKRLELTKLAISRIKPDLVVVDGVKDLMTDINDAVQATLLMEELMALAQRHNCCIVCVLHQNKSEGDHNMRGSIGTELMNKAFEVFQCEMIQESETFKVSQTYSRKHHIKQKMFYRLNDGGLPELCDDVQEQPRDAQGRFMTNKPRQTVTPAVKWEAFNPKYLVRNDGQPDVPYGWNLSLLFEDAFEGHNQRQFNQLMGAAMRLSHIEDKNYYYARFNEAEQQGVIRKFCQAESGVTWVELVRNTLPF